MPTTFDVTPRGSSQDVYAQMRAAVSPSANTPYSLAQSLTVSGSADGNAMVVIPLSGLFFLAIYSTSASATSLALLKINSGADTISAVATGTISGTFGNLLRYKVNPNNPEEIALMDDDGRFAMVIADLDGETLASDADTSVQSTGFIREETTDIFFYGGNVGIVYIDRDGSNNYGVVVTIWSYNSSTGVLTHETTTNDATAIGSGGTGKEAGIYYYSDTDDDFTYFGTIDTTIVVSRFTISGTTVTFSDTEYDGSASLQNEMLARESGRDWAIFGYHVTTTLGMYLIGVDFAGNSVSNNSTSEASLATGSHQSDYANATEIWQKGGIPYKGLKPTDNIAIKPNKNAGQTILEELFVMPYNSQVFMIDFVDSGSTVGGAGDIRSIHFSEDFDYLLIARFSGSTFAIELVAL